jgi:hypothetical protein
MMMAQLYLSQSTQAALSQASALVMLLNHLYHRSGLGVDPVDEGCSLLQYLNLLQSV